MGLYPVKYKRKVSQEHRFFADCPGITGPAHLASGKEDLLSGVEIAGALRTMEFMASGAQLLA